MKYIKKLLTLLTILLFVSCTTEVIKYIYIDPTTGEQIDPDKLPNNGNTPDNPSTNDPENPAVYIRTTESKVSLPDSPANSAFAAIAPIDKIAVVASNNLKFFIVCVVVFLL